MIPIYGQAKCFDNDICSNLFLCIPCVTRAPTAGGGENYPVNIKRSKLQYINI